MKRPAFCVLILFTVTLAASAQATFTFLSAPHASVTEPFGLNNAGQVVGYYQPPLNHWHGFIYDINLQTYTTLAYPGPPGTVSTTIASGINDAGAVVGPYIKMNNGIYHAYQRDSAGNYSTITVPNAHGSQEAWAINNFGDIVGFYALPGVNKFNSFLLQQGVFTTLRYPGSNYTVAEGINDAGAIVGIFLATNTQHGFLYANGTFTEVIIPGATLVQANGINNLGDIVGFYEDAAKQGHGFLLKQGVVQTIDCPGTSQFTSLYGVNDSDMFVGQCASGGFFGTP